MSKAPGSTFEPAAPVGRVTTPKVEPPKETPAPKQEEGRPANMGLVPEYSIFEAPDYLTWQIQ